LGGVPALPGCVTHAETFDELRSNLKEAIKLWLDAEVPVPAPNGTDRILELAL
jgi:predicted RNase H-like HicB family nuclease